MLISFCKGTDYVLYPLVPLPSQPGACPTTTMAFTHTHQLFDGTSFLGCTATNRSIPLLRFVDFQEA